MFRGKLVISRSLERSLTILVLVLLPLTFLLVVDGKSQTLADYLHESELHNPGLKAAEARYMASRARSVHLSGHPDPSVNIGIAILPVESRLGPQQARLYLRQPIPWFGLLDARRTTGESTAQALQEEYRALRSSLRRDVRQVYYHLHELDGNHRLYMAQLEILTTHTQLLTNTIAAGTASLADVLRVEMEVEDLKVQLELIQERRVAVEQKMRVLLNRSDTSRIEVSQNHTIGEADITVQGPRQLDSLLRNHPRIQSLAMRRAASDALALQRSKEGMPTLSLGIDYVLTGARDDIAPLNNGRDAIIPTLQFSVPLFRSKFEAGVNEAELQSHMYTLTVDNELNKMVAMFEQERYVYQEASRKFKLYSHQIVRNQRLLDLLLAEYRNSGNDFDDLLTTQSATLELQVQQAAMVRQYFTALAQIYYLTETVGVGVLSE